MYHFWSIDDLIRIFIFFFRVEWCEFKVFALEKEEKMGDIIHQLPVTKKENEDIGNNLLLDKVFGISPPSEKKREGGGEGDQKKNKEKKKSNVKKHIILFLFIFALVFSNLMDKMVNDNVRESMLFLPGKCVLGLVIFMICSL